MSDSDIVTRCPQCNTAFRVTPNQLAVADGVVRCGSCLAVFKAVDYEADKKETPTESPSTPEATESQANPLSFEDDETGINSQNDSEELFIDNDEESALTLNEDIYDLDVDNRSKKTSLFDRKIKPITQHTRESADESWALDMLAELEDEEEFEAQQIIRKPQADSIQEELKADDDDEFELEIDLDPQLEPRTESKIEPTIAAESFNSEASLEINLEPDSDLALEFDSASEYELEYDEESGTSENHEDHSDYSEHNEIGDSKPQIEGMEALYFEDDEYTSPDSADQPTHQHSHPEANHISDEEIENAMHSRTSYVDDAKGYLANIEPAPVEMEWYGSESTQRWLWFSGAILMALLLLVQVATFRFDTLSKNTTYRPLYETACNIMGCQLPNLIDTKKIRTTNLVVRSHPAQQNALVIDAILINNAQFQQPYPALRLEFSDINNKLIASRSLQPSEYLRGELAGATQMPANQPVQLSLSIVDPGDSAVNYQLTVIKASNQ